MHVRICVYIYNIYIYIHTYTYIKVAEWSNERVRYMYAYVYINIYMNMPHTVQQYHSRITLGPRSWAPSGCLFYKDNLHDGIFNVAGPYFRNYQGTASRIILSLEQLPGGKACPSKSPSGTPIVPLAFPMIEFNDNYTFTLPNGRTCTGLLTPNGFTNGLSCRGG
jgi:hypothetical protein